MTQAVVGCLAPDLLHPSRHSLPLPPFSLASRNQEAEAEARNYLQRINYSSAAPWSNIVKIKIHKSLSLSRGPPGTLSSPQPPPPLPSLIPSPSPPLPRESRVSTTAFCVHTLFSRRFSLQGAVEKGVGDWYSETDLAVRRIVGLPTAKFVAFLHTHTQKHGRAPYQ